jgi:predicted transcriptional regulator
MTSRFGIIPATIFDADLTPQDIALLALLSTYADKTGYCWPSYETIADKLNRSKGWVSQRVQILEAEGFLQITNRGSQKYGFRILYDTVQPAEQTVQPSERTVQPAEQNSTNNIQYRYAKKCTIPDDFKPTPEMLAYLAEHRPKINPQQFTENFITSCQAKGYLYKWWDAAWRKWVNSSPETTNGKAPVATRDNLKHIHDTFTAAASAVSGFVPRG